MILTIAETKSLKGGKTKLTTVGGVVYYAEAGLEIPATKNVEATVEAVEKDGKTFQVVKAIKAVEHFADMKPTNVNVDVEGASFPRLPTTSLPETKAPGGELPVKKAGANVKNVDDPNFMSKADWKNKDRNIELTALMKSTIESPAYRELVIGKNTDEALKTFDVLVDHYVEKLEELKGR